MLQCTRMAGLPLCIVRTAIFIFILAHSVCCFAQSRYPDLIPYYDNGKWGYCDSNKQILIEPGWDNAEFFSNGKARVKLGHIVSLIDNSGEYIIPPSRGWNGSPYTYFFNARDTANKKTGIIDTNNNVVIPIVYDINSSSKWIQDTSNNKKYFWGRRDGNYGLIDSMNNVVIDFKYNNLQLADTEKMLFISSVFKQGQGVVGIGNTEVLPPIYSSVNYRNGMWLVCQNNKCGLFDTFGKNVFPVKYDNIQVYPDSVKLIVKNRYAVADRNGKILTRFKRYKHEEYTPPFYSGRTCGGVQYIDPERYLLIPHGGKNLWTFSFEDKMMHSVLNLNRSSVEEPKDQLYVAMYGSGYSGASRDSPIEFIVDTNLQRRSANFPANSIMAMVGGFILCRENNEYVLYDTVGQQVSQAVNPAIGYIKDTNSNLLIATNDNDRIYSPYENLYNRHNDVRLIDYSYKKQHKNLVCDTMRDVSGTPLPHFFKYKSLRYIPLNAREALGRLDIIYATDSNGHEGIVDAYGRKTYPDVSFRYKHMDIIYGSMHYDNYPNKWIKMPKLPFYKGNFIVYNDDDNLGYFDSNGRALLPEINFKYQILLIQLSENVFIAKTSSGKILLIDKNNDNIFPGLTIKGISPMAKYRGLQVLAIDRGENQRSLNIYMSENGVLFAGEIE